MTLLSILDIRVPPERVDDLVSRYVGDGVLEASGALTADLAVDDDGSGRVVVTAVWPDRDAYAAWEESPVRTRFAHAIAAAVEGEITASGRTLELVHRS
ncbi:putative quinol monooxygenase [Mycetocola reblochoni]|uniref:ABM domain-containing protein n=2 Tax=Mycetocola reblochoni TaxID=331618 RepID=A0A1R4IIX5_9MICO|nr:antibiotic biosynthesis monooxygenase family protein [Mycetocola reblochoni]SJN19747.1 hypothetical protein FM119_02020 [Mycetocola reblochoni REB411]